MKTKELEEMLDIPRSAIRFYEKQGLISPKRSEHSEEREYSTEDAERLQKIVLLRKLGFSVTVIKDLLDHRIDLQEQITQQIELLQKQQEELDGVLSLCREIQNSNITLDQIDPNAYLNAIHDKEEQGYTFFDILSAETVLAASRIEYSPGHGPRTPDLIYNPLQKQQKQLQGYWDRHRLLHIALLAAAAVLTILFIVFVTQL
ncbi:MAG: MerR family transcriptional regulator [Solobacterium sp.]|nr:MerR family transcriptional regulator [Solobacterium sp.]